MYRAAGAVRFARVSEDHADILRQEIRKLERPSLARYLARVAGNWLEVGAILGLAAWWWTPPVIGLAVLLLGTRQHALAMLAHDGAHYAASRTRWLNDSLVCLLVFYPLYGGLDGYRHFHFTHHRTTGRDDDPELAYKRAFAADWSLPLSWGRLLRLLLRDLTGQNLHQIVRLGAQAPPRSWADRVGPAAWNLVAALVLARLGALWVAGLWVAAFCTAHWAVFRLRVWTEHVGTRGTHRIHAGPLARFFIVPHNTWYHWEHHRYPGVPCWNLPAVRDLLGARQVLPLETLFEVLEHEAPMVAGIPGEG